MFALIALGFMLIVGVMEVINLAHGSLFALGAYFAIFIVGLNLGVGIEARYALAFSSRRSAWRWSACCSKSRCAGPTGATRSTGCSSPSARRS